MIVRPLEQVVSPLRQGASRVARVVEGISSDSTSFANTTRLVRATSESAINEFTKMFCEYFIQKMRRDVENNTHGLSRKLQLLSLKIREPIASTIQKIVSKLSTIEVLKDSQGKIIGGFSYGISGSNMTIGQMILEPSKRGTRQGMALLLKMAKRIKEIAIASKVEFIVGDVGKTEEHVSSLYEKAGFTRDTSIHIPLMTRMKVAPQDFCKKYFS